MSSVFLSYGFRPFFLFAALYAIIAMAAWMAQLAGGTVLPAALSPHQWHGHEMLFGFGVAAMAGFFLTATPNWSGKQPLKGRALGVLVVLWLAGRAAMWGLDVLPPLAVAVLDIAFVPALAMAILSALAGHLRRQGLFLGILVILTAGNVLFHLDRVAPGWADADHSLILALDSFVVLMTVLGGRVIPSFTLSHLRAAQPDVTFTVRPWLERAVIVGTLVFAVLSALDVTVAVAPLALALAVLHAWRLVSWQSWRAIDTPIVWVLHLGYLWIPIGLGLRGLAGFFDGGYAVAGIHALAVGAMATLILGIMSRAALGHTGRAVTAAPAIVASYILITLSAVARVATALIDAIPQTWGYGVSSLALLLAFALFVAVYGPILTGPRADGKPI